MRDIIFLIAYIFLIYGTIPIAPIFTVRIAKMLGYSYSSVMNAAVVDIILALSAIFYFRFRKPRPINYPLVTIVFLIYLFILFYYTPIIAEKLHLLEYGFLSYLAMRVAKRTPSLNARYLYTILIIIIVGSFDEFTQNFIPGRVYEVRDIYLNILSGLLGLSLVRLLRR